MKHVAQVFSKGDRVDFGLLKDFAKQYHVERKLVRVMSDKEEFSLESIPEKYRCDIYFERQEGRRNVNMKYEIPEQMR